MGSDSSPRDVALRLLAQREHSFAELRVKLAGRGFSETETMATLAALADAGLQSDARYAEVYVRSRAGRSYGPLRIRAELRQRGVDAQCIDTALADHDEDWDAIARAHYRRHFGGRPPRDYTERAKRLRHMQQRGFDMQTLRTLTDIGDAAEDD
ncbi:regulatory protein RecX [Acidihalobacter ferrooxydans]|uniref:Regulatory protein RecX n=1 Tax=Acidihalobacter ferrooxydans TaxID=1765967 RepID=A0A1P8UEI3_9GAMM|nr:regulatory protein RecX [Acidihalobacter ferrooxydans]APZ42241.1 hypothetical protein BW247_03320 [Acidihalobacter ferrooxydans]